ncbi:MAG: hypothetical protein C0392_08760 [Syntrophus sp. (in: bacteria)]|nr:hypothetical protein [Syntrophus sp. (in: bacteria)]
MPCSGSYSMVKIKFCGMTNMDDCLAARDLGVDFIGFVFYRKSKRYIEPVKVREITERLQGKAKTVGVFVEETEEEIRDICAFCGLDFAQVYGRAGGITNKISVYRIKDRVPDVNEGGLILFDSNTDGFGGSGTPFDLDLLKGHQALSRVFIAGGIGETNVYDALRLNPFGIDLVSSIEAYGGKKDLSKMKSLVSKVRSFRI